MISFSRQCNARQSITCRVRNIIVGKWLNNEGIANIIQYLIQYFSSVLQYYSSVLQYFSSVLQYFSWVLQYLIHQHANSALQVLTQYSKFGNVIRNIQNKLGKRALKSDLKSTVIYSKFKCIQGCARS